MIFYVRPRTWWARVLFHFGIIRRTVSVTAVSGKRLLRPMWCKVWTTYILSTKNAILTHETDGKFYEIINADNINRVIKEMEEWRKKS